MAPQTATRLGGLTTIKISEFTSADPEHLRDMDDPIREYVFSPEDYDPDAIHGFYLHRARKDALGMSWLEYINAQSPSVVGPDSEAIAAAVAESLTGFDDATVAEIVERVSDDLSADVREAAYHGAAEAIRDAR